MRHMSQGYNLNTVGYRSNSTILINTPCISQALLIAEKLKIVTDDHVLRCCKHTCALGGCSISTCRPESHS